MTLEVKGCDGCTIAPASVQKAGDQYADWIGPVKTVRDGEVTFRLPKTWTPWMYFTIQPKVPSGVYNSETLIAMRYDGFAVGQRVSRAQAASGDSAYGCWAGTTARAITMKVVVTRFPATSVDGQVSGPHIRAFMSRGKPTVGSAGSTFEGSLGTQDPYFCYF